MENKALRLTESELNRVIREAIHNVLNEEVDMGQVTAQSEKKSTASQLPNEVRSEIRKLRHQIDKFEGEGKDTTELTNKIKKLKNKHLK